MNSTNPTGATHLYESVGVHVETAEILWEKWLV